jgi:alkaline phosphatase D
MHLGRPVNRRGLLVALPVAFAAHRALALLPPPRDLAISRIAFGSCANQNRPQPIWDAVLAYRPELFIFAGDNVYGDVSSEHLDELKWAYARAREISGFMRLRREVPVLATWDDHDYGRNDAGVEFPWKRETKELFLEFWEAPIDDPRRGRDGVYDAVVLGPEGRRTQLILLDTCWFRSPLKDSEQRHRPGFERYEPDDDPAKTMLGAEQWRWLEAQLRVPAELRLVVSSTQILAEGHGWERWGNLPRERRRLYDLIAATRASGVIFLSGDRHLGALYRESANTPYPLLEITSSGINRRFPSRERGPNRVGAIFGNFNFGTIDIDWSRRGVTLSVRDIAGVAQRRLDVALDDLAVR